MKLSQLLYPGEYRSESDPTAISVSGIVSDTRRLYEGCLYICLRGARFDSHTLLERIKEGGAAAVLVEHGAPCPPAIGIPVFEVESTRVALALAWSRFCGEPSKRLHMIGITGTNGKTSTASMLYGMLRQSGKSVGLIGTVSCLYNDRHYTLPADENAAERLRTMTTPDPDVLYPMLAKMQSEGVEYVVMEVSSHALALHKTDPIFFEIGIFTNLTPEHLDFHDSMEAYLAAKARLFQRCGVGIFNCDSEYAEPLITASSCEIKRAGIAYNGEYRATDIQLFGSHGLSYCYCTPTSRLRIRSRIPGAFTVYNSMLALTAALSLGLPAGEAVAALQTMAPVPGRLERIPLGEYESEFSVFIDFAHTEEALRSLLTTVRGFRRADERILLLFGCGGDRDKSKRAPMGRVAESLADHVIITSDNSRTEDPKAILADILSGMTGENHTVIRNRRRAIEHAVMNAGRGDILLLCGKGHETYEINAAGVHPFNEREIVRAALEKRKAGDTVHED